MSSMAVDGLASGLNTSELISSLMYLEAAPQRQLQDKSSTASRIVTALQGLNTKVASLGSAATKATEAKSWDSHTVTSSSAAVKATATTGAQAATLTFSVDSLAQGQVSMLSGLDPSTATALTITRSDGESFEVFPQARDAAKGLTVDDVATAINEAKDAGVSAVKVQVGTGADGTPVYGLQLSGAAGAKNAFTLRLGAESAGDTLAPVASSTLRSAQDAKITLWPGAEGEAIEITSTTNTFEGVLPGVSFTATATTEPDEPATLTVAADTASRRKLLTDIVSNVGVVLSDISSRTKSSTTTQNGREVVSGGLLAGDTTVRFLTDNLRSAMSMPVDGKSPSSIGVTLDRYGAVTVDEEAFDKAMAADPEGTQAVVMAIAGRVNDLAETASDPTSGTLSQKITAQESTVKDLGRQVEEWDRRLDVRRIGLTKTYTNLEVALSNLQSQSTWLAGQLASLPSYNNNSKS